MIFEGAASVSIAQDSETLMDTAWSISLWSRATSSLLFTVWLYERKKKSLQTREDGFFSSWHEFFRRWVFSAVPIKVVS